MARVATPVRKKSKKTEARHREREEKTHTCWKVFILFPIPFSTHPLALARVVISLFLT